MIMISCYDNLSQTFVFVLRDFIFKHKHLELKKKKYNHRKFKCKHTLLYMGLNVPCLQFQFRRVECVATIETAHLPSLPILGRDIVGEKVCFWGLCLHTTLKEVWVFFDDGTGLSVERFQLRLKKWSVNQESLGEVIQLCKWRRDQGGVVVNAS